MGISNLRTHSASYVTVAELAEYWEVTRQLVYKHIQTGLLPAMRLGPRCFRVRTADAIDFERQLSSKSSSVPARTAESCLVDSAHSPASARRHPTGLKIDRHAVQHVCVNFTGAKQVAPCERTFAIALFAGAHRRGACRGGRADRAIRLKPRRFTSDPSASRQESPCRAASIRTSSPRRSTRRATW